MSKFCANNCGIFQGAYNATYHLLEACQVMESSRWKSAAEGNPAKQPLPQNRIGKNSKRTLGKKKWKIFQGPAELKLKALNWSSFFGKVQRLVATAPLQDLAINIRVEKQRKTQRASTQLAYYFFKHTLAFIELQFAFLYIWVVLFIVYLGRIIKLKGQLYQA